MSNSTDSIDRVFVQALNTVRKLPRMGTAKPPAQDRLKLYGLYKQAMEGNVEDVMARPDNDNTNRDEGEKWDSWNTYHGLSRTAAKRQYISALISAMHRYATSTPEARELVAELEFVWDQVNANTLTVEDEQERRRRRPSSPPRKVNVENMGVNVEPDDTRARAPTRRPKHAVVVGLGIRTEGGSSSSNSNVDPFTKVRSRKRSGPDAAASFAGMPMPTPGLSETVSPSASELLGTPHSRMASSEFWRQRIESTLVTLHAELAALREQVEISNRVQKKRDGGAWAWVSWLAIVAVKHAAWDACVVAVVLLWTRCRGNDRAKDNLKQVWQRIRSRSGNQPRRR